MYNYKDYLAHHGIEGQKWGQQNGPPYPLDANGHSAAEKRAGTSGWTKEARKVRSADLSKEEYDKRMLEAKQKVAADPKARSQYVALDSDDLIRKLETYKLTSVLPKSYANTHISEITDIKKAYNERIVEQAATDIGIAGATALGLVCVAASGVLAPSYSFALAGVAAATIGMEGAKLMSQMRDTPQKQAAINRGEVALKAFKDSGYANRTVAQAQQEVAASFFDAKIMIGPGGTAERRR